MDRSVCLTTEFHRRSMEFHFLPMAGARQVLLQNPSFHPPNIPPICACAPLSLTILHPIPRLSFEIAFVSQLSAIIAQERVRRTSSKSRQCRLPAETNLLPRRYREISHHAPRTATRPHTGNFVKKLSYANMHAGVCTVSEAIG